MVTAQLPGPTSNNLQPNVFVAKNGCQKLNFLQNVFRAILQWGIHWRLELNCGLIEIFSCYFQKFRNFQLQLSIGRSV